MLYSFNDKQIKSVSEVEPLNRRSKPNTVIENFVNIHKTKIEYSRFIKSCRTEEEYRLTPRSEVSPYALCFAIFGYNLLGYKQKIQENKAHWDMLIRRELELKREERKYFGKLNRDKPYLQLLTFSLSALFILGTLKADPLAEEVLELIPDDVGTELKQSGALAGIAGTGNHAMFLGVFLIHAKSYLGIDTDEALDTWSRLHLASMNQFGFWGLSKSMSHLQFQNGYHQYEIMDYLQTEKVPWNKTADNVALLADREGHFAPYPGGGGCYDYDATFILTGAGSKSAVRYRDLLVRTARTILAKQGLDGGFSESIYVRPRSVDNISRSARHVFSAHGQARLERLRQSLTLLRPKHNRIDTHWTEYSRRWGESDLWDSWFRMQTIARIDVALDPERISEWGFINYPGIGFHSALHKKSDTGSLK